MTPDLPAALTPPRLAHTTLNAIKAKEPCALGWRKLLAHLGKTKADDEPLSLLTILESNGLTDALWALRCACKGYGREARLSVIAYALDARHLMLDPRSVAAVEVADRYAHGHATRTDLVRAQDAAWSAWAAARTLDAAAGAAVLAAEAAGQRVALKRQTAHFIRIFGGSDD